MIRQIEGCIEQFAGKVVAQKIMEGSENITEKTAKKKTAQFVQKAMQKLDVSVDRKTRVRIMQNCGYNCAKKNHNVIARGCTAQEIRKHRRILGSGATETHEGNKTREGRQHPIPILYTAGVHETHEVLLWAA